MATETISQEEMQRYDVAAQQFLADIEKRYPTLDISGIITPVINELKDMGLYRQNISVKSFHAGFLSAVNSGNIKIPPQEPVLDDATIQRIRSKFPPVIKSVPREMSQKEKSALAGIASQTGRRTAADRREADSHSSKNFATARDLTRLSELRAEYRALKVQAETAMGSNPKNHAETQSVRKAALKHLNSDPRFAEVRSE